MTAQYSDIDKETDDGFEDISDENISKDDNDNDVVTEPKKEFQKFIKKISRPS